MAHWPSVKRSQPCDGESSKRHKHQKKTWESIGLCPEILAQIFKNVEFERLKIYRHVCKTWNQEICRVLNATTEVTEKKLWGFQETVAKDRVDRREQLLELLKEGEKLGLPAPFKSLYMVETLRTGKLENISVIRELSDRIAITRLAFWSYRPNTDTNIIQYIKDLLIICSESLTVLEMPYRDPERDLPKIAIQFPRITKLILKRPSVPINFVEAEHIFLETLILSSPNLKEIVLENIPRSPSLLKTMDLRKVEQLTVSNPCAASFANATDVWTDLKYSRFTNLKALTLGMNLIGIKDSEFQTLIAHFSDSIERLSVSKVRIVILPLCPKLTHLDCETLLAAAWDPSLLPALKSLKLKFFYKARQMTPHPFQSVDKIYCYQLVNMAVEQAHLFQKQQRKEEVLGQLMSLLPNATSWTLTYPFLEGFTHVAPTHELNVESLTILMSLRFDPFEDSAVLPSTHTERTEYERTFAALSQLSALKALTFVSRHESPTSNRLLVEAIDFKSMPNLRTFRHIGAGLDKCLDLMEHHLSSLQKVVILYWRLYASSDESQDYLKLLTRFPNLELAYMGIHSGKSKSFTSRYR